MAVGRWHGRWPGDAGRRAGAGRAPGDDARATPGNAWATSPGNAGEWWPVERSWMDEVLGQRRVPLLLSYNLVYFYYY